MEINFKQDIGEQLKFAFENNETISEDDVENSLMNRTKLTPSVPEDGRNVCMHYTNPEIFITEYSLTKDLPSVKKTNIIHKFRVSSNESK